MYFFMNKLVKQFSLKIGAAASIRNGKVGAGVP